MDEKRANIQVILVDNRSEWLDFGRNVLAEAGYAVQTAQAAADAVNFLEGNRLILTIIDSLTIQEHEASFRRFLQAQSRTRHRVVAAFSTALTPDNAADLFKLGAHDCVDKPYDKTGLLTLVEQQIAESIAKVLIVEDEEDWRKRLVRYLSGEPYRIEVASDYPSALGLLREQSFDAVVLDLRLVEEDDRNFEGMELLRLLREKDQNVAIIIVSAYGTVEYVREGFKIHGILDYVPKQSFAPDKYRQVVREAIQKQQDSSQSLSRSSRYRNTTSRSSSE